MSTKLSRGIKLAVARDLVEAIGYAKVVAGIQAIYDDTMNQYVEAECLWLVARLAADYGAEHGHIPEWFAIK